MLHGLWPYINDCAPLMISVEKFPEMGLLGGKKGRYDLKTPKCLQEKLSLYP